MDALTTFERLVRVQTRLWNDVDRALLDAGHPGLAWLSVLRVVDATPGCRVGDVSRALDVTHGGLSKLADRMVIAGLLDRAAHPSDRRASVLTLTPSGRSARIGAESLAGSWLAPRLREVGAHHPLATHLTDIEHRLGETA